MKITILDPLPGEEDEIIIRCGEISDGLRRLLHELKHGVTRLNAYQNGQIFFLEPSGVFYFESVDERVYAYCETEVYEVKSRLYELEALLPVRDFMRASKSLILNLSRVQSLSPAFGGRFEALMQNGERVIISRQYVPVLKEKLGL